MKKATDTTNYHTMSTDRSTLRRIKALIAELEVIEEACVGKTGKKKNKDLDEFQQTKLDLNDELQMLKDDIKTRKGLEERMGTTAESIKLKSQIKARAEKCKQLHRQLEGAWQQNERDLEREGQKEGGSKMNAEELQSRKELMDLMKQDLEYTENEFEPKKATSGGGGFKVAQAARERRRKKREQGLVSDEPVPLTAKQQQFIQESIQRDKVLDEKLDIIKQGVQQLNAIGQDINEELDKQAVMLDEVGQKMDAVTEKIESRNEQIKKLLDASGGATRWCPVLILLIILLACGGYIYNAFIA